MSFSLFLSAKKYSCTVIAILLILSAVIFMSKASYPPKQVSLSVDESPIAFIRSDSRFPEPSLSARSAVLIECESGEVIFGKDESVRLPMASTTKIMTALTVIEDCSLSDTVVIRHEACGIEGSSIYLREGERFTVEELLYALMLASANDAATALALHAGGSIEAFTDKMNEKASSLGLTDTHFTNPHGLYDSDHYTTARDLALIAAYASKNESFKKICSTKKTVIGGDKDSARLLSNHNKMLFSYDGAFGIKTGFTKNSGRCLVTGATREGMSLIAVTLNAPDDWNDHKAMLDYGFALYEKRMLIDKGELSVSLPLVGSLQGSVLCTNSTALYAILPKGASDAEYTAEIKRFEFAPVCKGECVGRLIFKYKGKTIAQCEIITAYNAMER